MSHVHSYISTLSNTLPAQAIPTRKKTKEWGKNTVDALERIGVQQLRENVKYEDVYRMMRGDVAYHEAADLIPHLKGIADTLLQDYEIPSHIKHHDIIDVVVIDMVKLWKDEQDGKFQVHLTDTISQNERGRFHTEELNAAINEQLENEINYRIAERGINPDPSQVQFSSQEEQQSYLQQLAQLRQQFTPSYIKTLLNKPYNLRVLEWADKTLKTDHAYFNMDLKFGEQLRTYLWTGKAFRHMRQSYDCYKPENWRVRDVFHDKNENIEYIQDGEYVGRITHMTVDELIGHYGHRLTEKEIRTLSKDHSSDELYGINKRYGIDEWLRNKGEQVFEEPFKGAWQMHKASVEEDYFGVPLGTTTYIGKNGENKTYSSWVNDFIGGSYNQRLPIKHTVADGTKNRKDYLQVTEVYWKSLDRFGILHYLDESQNPVLEIVTDEILPEFLKENCIKELRTVSPEDFRRNPQINTICWSYRPVTYWAVKITPKNGLEYVFNNEGSEKGHEGVKSIYLGMERTELQIYGCSEEYNVELPVSGVVNDPFVKRMYADQATYNVQRNKYDDLLARELGLLLFADVRFLPKAFTQKGKPAGDALLEIHRLAKDVGIIPTEVSAQALRGGGQVASPFQVQDLSYTNQLNAALGQMNQIKEMAWERVGYTITRRGNASEYSTKEGIVTSMNASHAQPAFYFERFNEFKRRSLHQQLAVAQFAQKNLKDISVRYFGQSDNDSLMLRSFQDDYFHARRFHLNLMTSHSERKANEQYKVRILNDNTMPLTSEEMLNLLNSNSIYESVNIARDGEARRQELQAQAQQQQQLLIQEQARVQDEVNQREWERQELSKQRDRVVKIRVEEIEALGRAADNNSSQSEFDVIKQAADSALKRAEFETDLAVKQEDLQIRRDDAREKRRMEQEKVDLARETNRIRREEIQAKERIAIINKN